MKQILPICCFCEKVHDGARTEAGEGLWQDMKIYTVSRGLRPLNTIFAYSSLVSRHRDPHRSPS